ncbi:hypothetical protein ACG7TL_001171 [Trametes sanguinea]
MVGIEGLGQSTSGMDASTNMGVNNSMHLTTTSIVSQSLSASSMSSSRSLTSSGPFYVVLGGEDFGIYEGTRPVNMALGNFRPLLPIVVCCPLLQDAESLNKLNSALFVKVASDDAYTLLQYIQWDEGPVAKVRLNTPGPYYAIRTAKAGKETGIWIGYPWGPLSHNVAKDNAWHRYDTIQECLAFMVEKYDYNLPLLPHGVKLPPPKEPLGYARADAHTLQVDESASTSHHRAPSTIKREPSQHVARPARTPSPIKPERPSSPVKSSRKRVALVEPSSQNAAPSPICLLRSPSGSAHTRGGSRRPVSLQEVPDSPTDNSDLEDSASTGNASLVAGDNTRDATLSNNAWLNALQRLIRMPAAMGSNTAAHFPVNFGPTAENLLQTAGASEEDVWRIFQIRVHARTPEVFTHHIGLQLGPAEVFIRLPNAARKAAPKRVRFPWRERRRRERIRRSRAEKRELQQRRDEKKEKLTNALVEARAVMWELAVKMHEDFPGHSARYYYDAIMQRARMRQTPRKISPWNAFVSQELQKYNEEADDDTRKRVSSEVIKEIAARWRSMSQEERLNAVGDGVEKLAERRDNRKHGVHNVAIASFNDVRATLSTIAHELDNLNGRTGTDILLVAVRSKPDQYNRPYVFFTNDRITQFISSATAQKETINQFAMRVEAACIGGLEEVVHSRKDELQNLKNRTAKLISDKLKQACVRGQARKMFYVNFDHHVTLPHGVVLEGWPPNIKFAAPGKFNSIPELQTLYSAWDTGATRFRSLTNTEWRDWVAEYKRRQDPNAIVADHEAESSPMVLDNEYDDTTPSSPAIPASSSPAVPASSSSPAVPTSSSSLAVPASLSPAVPVSSSPAIPASSSPAVPTSSSSLAVPASLSPAVPVSSSPAVPASSSPAVPASSSSLAIPASSSPTTPASSSSAAPAPSLPVSASPPHADPASSSPAVVASSSAAPASSESTATAIGRKRPRTNALQVQFLNAVTTADGSGIIVPKRARKERSDKNTKKGPRKKRENNENSADSREDGNPEAFA